MKEKKLLGNTCPQVFGLISYLSTVLNLVLEFFNLKGKRTI